MKSVKTFIAAMLIAMAGTASAQTKNYVHITKTDNSKIELSQDDIQSMIIDTKAPAVEADYVEFTSGTSTVKVATMNLGAESVAGDNCYGNYYAWGATTTFATVDQSTGTVTPTKTGGYSQANAPYWNGSAYTKYINASPSDVELAPADDAVAANMPGWHMPTRAEMQTLYAACGGSYEPTATISADQAYPSTAGIYWVTGGVTIDDDTYKVNGLLFVQDADHHVFFPAAGSVHGTTLSGAGSGGSYWSTSLNTDYTGSAYFLIFDNVGVIPGHSNSRYYGFPVRPFKN